VPCMAAHPAQTVDVSEIPSVCSILLNATRLGGSGLIPCGLKSGLCKIDQTSYRDSGISSLGILFLGDDLCSTEAALAKFRSRFNDNDKEKTDEHAYEG